jgi:alpha-ribazole phosphatase
MNGKPSDPGQCIIYLLRHGDSRRDDVKRFIGQTDTPLNEIGRGQAEWWRKELSSFPFSRIYCSDLNRSRETAQIICKNSKGPIQELPELREINLGQWDGLPVQEVRRRYPGEFEKRGVDLVPYRPAGGESFYDVRERVVPVFERISRDLESGRILITGHAGVNRIILCHLLGMPLANLFRLGQDYGCLNIIACEAGRCRLHAANIPPGSTVSGLI